MTPVSLILKNKNMNTLSSSLPRNDFGPNAQRTRALKPWMRHSPTLVLTSLLTLLAGCAGTTESGVPSKQSAPASAATEQTPFDTIVVGMTAVEIKALVGAPQEIKPYKPGDLQNEIWVYDHFISEQVRLVSVGTQELPLMNPITGVMGTTKEDIMTEERVRISEIIEMLMVDGRLAAVKRKPKSDRKID